VWKTTSTPSRAGTMEAASARSPRQMVAPIRSSAAASPCGRARAWTVMPRATHASARWLPTKPVAPVIRQVVILPEKRATGVRMVYVLPPPDDKCPAASRVLLLLRLLRLLLVLVLWLRRRRDGVLGECDGRVGHDLVLDRRLAGAVDDAAWHLVGD